MKKVLMIFLMLTVTFCVYAKDEHEKEYYLYNIVNFDGKLKKESFKVTIDNGKTIEKLKDKDGNRIKFTTPAGALMYFISQGWELYSSGATTQGSAVEGSGSNYTSSYWIIRKPCSKEDFDKAVANSIKQSDY